MAESSHFKTLPVTKRISLKKFVEESKLIYRKGCGYYQLTKAEIIQDYKGVLARRKSDGQFITGHAIKEVLGIKASEKKFSLELSEIPDFDVFVQSTSVNRILLPGTDFVYEEESCRDDSVVPPKVEEKTPSSGTKRKTKGDKSSPAKKMKKDTGKSEAGSKSEDVGKSEAGGKSEAADKSEAAAAAAGGPEGPLEIVFSFDTTGSMYPCLTQVRRKISETVKRLQEEIPGIRIAVIAHGDYCDNHTYVTKVMDFTTNGQQLCTFVQNVEATGGGDWEECYELVLHEARTKLSWTSGTQRSLVLIGDAIPHSPSYPLNTKKLDWKKEATQLYNELGVKIYSVQALNNSESTTFYRELANLTHGYHLHLDQFSSIVQFIMAICFREQSMDTLQAYEDEIRKGTSINRSLHKLFDVLANRKMTPYVGVLGGAGAESSEELTPVDPARFQVLDVDERCDIRTYVQKNGLIFKTGRGFYEFTKPEKISDKKEVVLVDKVTGDMYTGPEACRVIGAGGSSRIKPTSLDKWRVFVQSTSYNRVLMPGTGFLYEVDPDH